MPFLTIAPQICFICNKEVKYPNIVYTRRHKPVHKECVKSYRAWFRSTSADVSIINGGIL